MSSGSLNGEWRATKYLKNNEAYMLDWNQKLILLRGSNDLVGCLDLPRHFVMLLSTRSSVMYEASVRVILSLGI